MKSKKIVLFPKLNLSLIRPFIQWCPSIVRRVVALLLKSVSFQKIQTFSFTNNLYFLIFSHSNKYVGCAHMKRQTRFQLNTLALFAWNYKLVEHELIIEAKHRETARENRMLAEFKCCECIWSHRTKMRNIIIKKYRD